MKKAKFITPAVTAFDENGNLDIAANKAIWDFLIKNGVDGLLIMGSIGEFASMTAEQKKELIKLAITYVNKRTKVYIGTADMRVDETINLSNFALAEGADAVMVISPYYFSISDESIEFFYDKVADGIKGNMYLYNFPARIGYDLSPAVTLKLLRKHKNIVGYKDSVSEMGHTRKLMTTVLGEFPGFEIYSGFDENFVHNILGGGSGCIGGLSNIYPELCVKWAKAINDKKLDEVEKIQLVIDKMMDIYDIGLPFIPIIKKAMILRGIKMNDYSIEPFLGATDAQVEKIKIILKEINLI
ncbi:MAG: dihydrodipicolinate synthase family protein [Fusobacteriaceae bacterium]|jgi:4-hydroxy-tetrahydrodipicolinate synthase|nr:dihydrodipicolinate synthase family protein [Fusobacteriaceae bacterium]